MLLDDKISKRALQKSVKIKSEEGVMDKADVAFLLASSGLVLLMIPGLAFSVVVVGVYAFVVSRVLFKVIHSLVGMRLSDNAEVEGLDSAEHSETAYNN